MTSDFFVLWGVRLIVFALAAAVFVSIIRMKADAPPPAAKPTADDIDKALDALEQQARSWKRPDDADAVARARGVVRKLFEAK